VDSTLLLSSCTVALTRLAFVELTASLTLIFILCNADPMVENAQLSFFKYVGKIQKPDKLFGKL
jgi:hypothetical protein